MSVDPAADQPERPRTARCRACGVFVGYGEDAPTLSYDRPNQLPTRRRLDEVKARMASRVDAEVTWAYVYDRLMDVWWYYENQGQAVDS